jgi:hypothetical protein
VFENFCNFCCRNMQIKNGLMNDNSQGESLLKAEGVSRMVDLFRFQDTSKYSFLTKCLVDSFMCLFMCYLSFEH